MILQTLKVQLTKYLLPLYNRVKGDQWIPVLTNATLINNQHHGFEDDQPLRFYPMPQLMLKNEIFEGTLTQQMFLQEKLIPIEPLKTPQKDLCSNSFTMSFAKLQHYQTGSKFDKNKSADF